jgi:hypothetical protein
MSDDFKEQLENFYNNVKELDTMQLEQSYNNLIENYNKLTFLTDGK